MAASRIFTLTWCCTHIFRNHQGPHTMAGSGISAISLYRYTYGSEDLNPKTATIQASTSAHDNDQAHEQTMPNTGIIQQR
jgi:hypothetical protein